MDIVITYVNGLDPVWQQEYAKYSDAPAMTKRFRDWGTLPFLLRGIEKNLPFTRKVFLVLSGPSQVPSWLNTETVQVVYHKDFIPQEYLPTFNSNTIEVFLHRIPGLSERFLYFNDDMFPMLPSLESDFFPSCSSETENLQDIRIRFSRHLLKASMYYQICANSDALVREAIGLKKSAFFVRPQHICSPMLRSVNEELFQKCESQILASLTRKRVAGNYTQYIYLNYLYHQGRAENRKISNKHFSVAATSAGKLARFIKAPTRAFCCINDVHVSDAHYEGMRKVILEAFTCLFPSPSQYEL